MGKVIGFSIRKQIVFCKMDFETIFLAECEPNSVSVCNIFSSYNINCKVLKRNFK